MRIFPIIVCLVWQTVCRCHNWMNGFSFFYNPLASGDCFVYISNCKKVQHLVSNMSSSAASWLVFFQRLWLHQENHSRKQNNAAKPRFRSGPWLDVTNCPQRAVTSQRIRPTIHQPWISFSVTTQLCSWVQHLTQSSEKMSAFHLEIKIEIRIMIICCSAVPSGVPCNSWTTQMKCFHVRLQTLTRWKRGRS